MEQSSLDFSDISWNEDWKIQDIQQPNLQIT